MQLSALYFRATSYCNLVGSRQNYEENQVSIFFKAPTFAYGDISPKPSFCVGVECP